MPICQRAQGLGKMKIFGAPGMPSLLKSCMWRGHPLQPISGNKWVFWTASLEGFRNGDFGIIIMQISTMKKTEEIDFLQKTNLGG